VIEGQAHGLIGRDSGAVRVDWDDFVRFQKSGDWEQALSLIAGSPLADVREDKLDVAELISGIREEVEEGVRLCLAGLDRMLPEPLDFNDSVFREFAPSVPLNGRRRFHRPKRPSLRRLHQASDT
jgi:hypothetical protein